MGEPDAKRVAIAFIGFGEAAQAFLRGWRAVPDFAAGVTAYDIKTDAPTPRCAAGKRADYAGAQHRRRHQRARGGRRGGGGIFLGHRRSGARGGGRGDPGPEEGALFFDCNSCAPQTKALTANEIDAAGAAYVDVAVMAPVHPRLHQTPLLISGPHGRRPPRRSPRSEWRPNPQGPVGSPPRSRWCARS